MKHGQSNRNEDLWAACPTADARRPSSTSCSPADAKAARVSHRRRCDRNSDASGKLERHLIASPLARGSAEESPRMQYPLFLCPCQMRRAESSPPQRIVDHRPLCSRRRPVASARYRSLSVRRLGLGERRGRRGAAAARSLRVSKPKRLGLGRGQKWRAELAELARVTEFLTESPVARPPPTDRGTHKIDPGCCGNSSSCRPPC